MGVRLPLGLFFKMKKKNMLKLDAFGIFFILILIGILFFITVILYLNKSPVLNDYPSAREFCIGKCGANNYYGSTNNSDKDIIICECFESAQADVTPWEASSKVETIFINFNATTLEEIK